MQPRSVAMGNKVYKLHIKHQTNKETLDVSPSLTFGELQSKIHDRFQVAPTSQRLLCNGKPLVLGDNITLKQAKIPNGSKILVQSPGSENNSPRIPAQMQQDSKLPAQMQNSGDAFHSSPASNRHSNQGSGSDTECVELKALAEVERKGFLLNNNVNLIGQNINDACRLSSDESMCELRRLKKESGGCGEQLMKQLEKLDQLRFSEQQLEARNTRKQLATLLNRVLDKNDSNLALIQDRLANRQSVL